MKKTWAVQNKKGGIPCLFGRRKDAREACDPDERVVQVEYRIVKVDK